MLVEDAPPPSFGYFIFHGTYTQRGHLGQIVADLQAPDRGSVTFTEIEKTAYGLVGRMSGATNDCVVVDGRFAASPRGF